MHFELKNRAFFTKTLHLMLPVILQQLITVGINFLDNLMIGGFGETQISAAAFGNQFYSLFQFICMGLGSGAVVMSSQFWGRKEHEPLRTTAGIALRVTAAICAAFTLLSVLFPQVIVRCFTGDAGIIAAGAPYMRLIGTTFLFSGLSSTATYLLRSVGNVRISFIGSIGAFFLNLFFNWVFIFGKLGAPRLELVGAAVGTVIARAFEFCFVFGYFILKDERIGFRFKHLFRSGASLKKQYFKYSVPVLVSDTLLGLSLSLTTVIVGHVGENLSAATSIVASIVNLLSVVNIGMAGASAVVVGNTIGEGDIPRAKREGNTYVLISVLFGLVCIPILMLLEQPYIGMYNISETTRAITHGMLICNYFMLPVQTMAYVISKGILRGGGDTRFLLFADSTLVWFFSLPLGALSGLVFHWGPVVTYLLLRLEFPLKGIVCLIRYLSGKWIRVISSSSAE